MDKVELDPNYKEQQAEFEARQDRIGALGQLAAIVASIACIGILLMIGFMASSALPNRGWLIGLDIVLLALAAGYVPIYRWMLASRLRPFVLAGLAASLFVLLGALELVASDPVWYLSGAFFVAMIAMTLSLDRWSILVCGTLGAAIYLVTAVWPAPPALATSHLLIFFFLLFAFVLIYAGNEMRRYIDNEIDARRDVLEKLATHDLLTGCLNQRGFQNALDREVERARRYNSVLSLMFVDIDYFKQINDEHGHLVGDEVLKKLGALISNTARRADLAGRSGGDELAILVPETPANSARVLANRIETNTRELKLPLTVSLSIGIGDVKPQEATTELLYQRADQALYRAKHEGRGRSVVFEETDVSDRQTPE